MYTLTVVPVHIEDLSSEVQKAYYSNAATRELADIVKAVSQSQLYSTHCSDARADFWPAVYQALGVGRNLTTAATRKLAGARAPGTFKLGPNDALFSCDHGDEQGNNCGGRDAAAKYQNGELTDDLFAGLAVHVHPNGRENAIRGLGCTPGVAAQYIHTTGDIFVFEYIHQEGRNDAARRIKVQLPSISHKVTQILRRNMQETGSHDRKGTKFENEQDPFFHVFNTSECTFAQLGGVENIGEAYEVKPDFRERSLQYASSSNMNKSVAGSIAYAWTSRFQTLIENKPHGFGSTDTQLIIFPHTADDKTDLHGFIASLVNYAPVLGQFYSDRRMGINILGIPVEQGRFLEPYKVIIRQEV